MHFILHTWNDGDIFDAHEKMTVRKNNILSIADKKCINMVPIISIDIRF